MGTGKCTFAQKVHFGAQNRKRCKNAILEPKSDFRSKNHFFGRHGGQVANLATCMWVREISEVHFLLQNALFAQNHFLRQKCILGPKCKKCTPKVILEPKVWFLRFGPKKAPFGLCFNRVWWKKQKWWFLWYNLQKSWKGGKHVFDNAKITKIKISS